MLKEGRELFGRVHWVAGSLRVFIGLSPCLAGLLTLLASLPTFTLRLLGSAHLTFRKSRIRKLVQLSITVRLVQKPESTRIIWTMVRTTHLIQKFLPGNRAILF